MAESFFPSRFQILEEITSNEAEVVVRAMDEVLEREVFLKRLGSGVRHLPGSERKRAMREAKALARIKHPSVLKILGVFETDAAIILEIEPVGGETLADRLAREAPLAVEEVVRITAEIADAMVAVHAQGIVHRNLSTTNVILKPEGGLCLTGFSFAKPGNRSLGHSSIDYRSMDKKKETALPKHPAPEQIAGHVADARSDIFGMGCILYECLSGRDAFPWGTTSTQPRDLRQHRPELSKALNAVVMKCLVQSPIGRFPTAGAFREALLACVEQKGAGSAGRRWPLVAGLAAGAAGLLLLLSTTGVFGSDRSRRDGPQGPGPRAEKRLFSSTYSDHHALLIGGNYENNANFEKLNNAEKDIDDLAAQLTRLNWKVTKVTRRDATRKRIMRALQDLDNVDVNSQVLVYFAGHGEAARKDPQSGYLIPTDAKLGERGDYISFAVFERWFNMCDAKHIMVMLDCCFGGTAVTSDKNRTVATRGGVYRGRALKKKREGSKYLTQKVRVVLSSVGPDEKAKDGAKGQNSPFARAFLSALASLQDGTEEAISSTLLKLRIAEAFEHDPDQTPHFKVYEGNDCMFYQTREKPGGRRKKAP